MAAKLIQVKKNLERPALKGMKMAASRIQETPPDGMKAKSGPTLRKKKQNRKA
jgi:hypothetical protein